MTYTTYTMHTPYTFTLLHVWLITYKSTDPARDLPERGIVRGIRSRQSTYPSQAAPRKCISETVCASILFWSQGSATANVILHVSASTYCSSRLNSIRTEWITGSERTLGSARRGPRGTPPRSQTRPRGTCTPPRALKPTRYCITWQALASETETSFWGVDAVGRQKIY